MFTRRIWPVAAIGTGILAAGSADAQLTIPVLQPVIPFTYSRGRNVSVTERDRPEYQAIGVQAGGFTLFPKIEAGLGFTDNVYESNSVKRSSAFYVINPTIRAVSNWSRNSLQAEAGGDIRRYTSASIRNQDGWHASGSGRLDIGSVSSATVDASTARQFETRFSGSSPTDIASAVPYQSSKGQLTLQSTPGRFRFTGVVNYTSVDFSAITLLSGLKEAQKNRNRNVVTGSGQVDYGLTPDVSVFAQVSYSDTSYLKRYSTPDTDRSSTQVRGIAGISLDISELVRGSIGVGYSSRNYSSPLYGRVSGLSLESRLEYFPTQVTTITFAARRAIEDSFIVNSSGYFNTGVGAQIDHEFLRNLIGNLGVDYEVDKYRGIDSKATIFAVNGGARYLFSRSVGVAANLTYGQRHNDGAVITGSQFSEKTGLLSFFIQR